jgi:tetratricopeptide (TPR) repeat protein
MKLNKVICCAGATLLTLCAAGRLAAADDAGDCRGLIFTPRPEAAIPACTRVLTRNPNEITAWMARATAYEAIGAKGTKDAYDLAIADFSQAIKLEPNAGIQELRANVYIKKGEYDRAIADYSETIRLRPDDADVWYKRGKVYMDKHAYERAIADFDQTLKLNPAHPDAGRFRTLAQALLAAAPDSAVTGK